MIESQVKLTPKGETLVVYGTPLTARVIYPIITVLFAEDQEHLQKKGFFCLGCLYLLNIVLRVAT